MSCYISGLPSVFKSNVGFLKKYHVIKNVDIANDIYVDTSTISRFLNNKRPLSKDKIEKICYSLGLPPKIMYYWDMEKEYMNSNWDFDFINYRTLLSSIRNLSKNQNIKNGKTKHYTKLNGKPTSIEGLQKLIIQNVVHIAKTNDISALLRSVFDILEFVQKHSNEPSFSFEKLMQSERIVKGQKANLVAFLLEAFRPECRKLLNNKSIEKKEVLCKKIMEQSGREINILLDCVQNSLPDLYNYIFGIFQMRGLGNKNRSYVENFDFGVDLILRQAELTIQK